MVPSHPELGRRGLLTALLLASALLPALAGQAARLTEELIEFSSSAVQFRSEGGTQLIAMRELTLTQGAGTRINAGVADVSTVGEGYRDSTWRLSSEVHVEHDGTVLDAPAATVVFADSRVQAVDVQGTPDNTARFSHQNSATGTRYYGSSASIRFEPASGDVLFQPPVQFNQGGSQFVCTKAIVYNVNTNSFETVIDGRTDTGCKASVELDDARRVPPQRQPERDQAQ